MGRTPSKNLEAVCSENQGEMHLDIIPNREQDDFDAGSGLAGGKTNAATVQWRYVFYAKINSTQIKMTAIEDHQLFKLAQLEN